MSHRAKKQRTSPRPEDARKQEYDEFFEKNRGLVDAPDKDKGRAGTEIRCLVCKYKGPHTCPDLRVCEP